MTEIQDQYTEFAKRGQDAATGVVEAWTKSVQDATAQFPSVVTPAAANQVVDQFFDFTAQMIDVQRTLIKQFISTSAGLAEDVTKNVSEHTTA